MPSTPSAGPPKQDRSSPSAASQGPAPRAEASPDPEQGASARTERPVAPEPEYLITGTGCTAGHVRGHELDAGRLGRVPTKRATRTGFFLVLWCAIGVGLVVDTRWIGLGLQLLAIWLAFSAIVQRRAGHRGHCWRTRSWRHAWGGLAPSSSDPTRPAGT